MKRLSQKFFSSLILSTFVLFLTLPFLASAQAGNTGITYVCPPKQIDGQTVYGDCTFGDVMLAIKKLTNWGSLFAIQFTIIVIAYAGFNYMVSGDNPGKRAEANKMLRKSVTGIILICAAWLIVTLITRALGVNTGGLI